MNTLNRLLLTLALGAGSTLPLTAQTDTPQTEGRPGPRHTRNHHRGPAAGHFGHPIVRALDTDKDRELSATEIANAPAALRVLDADADGNVTMREFFARREGARKGPAGGPRSREGASERLKEAVRNGRPSDPVMLALDANGDRVLSEDEIARATASLSAIDANKDGKLTPDELRPLPPVGEAK